MSFLIQYDKGQSKLNIEEDKKFLSVRDRTSKQYVQQNVKEDL